MMLSKALRQRIFWSVFLFVVGGGIVSLIIHALINEGVRAEPRGPTPATTTSERWPPSTVDSLPKRVPDSNEGSQGARQPQQAPQSAQAAAKKLSGDSFARSDDLWALAVRASYSVDPRLQYQGIAATRECAGLIGVQESLRVQIQSDATSRAKRDAALTELLRRCRGFLTSDANSVRANSQRLIDIEATNRSAPEQPSIARAASTLRQLNNGSTVDTQSSLVEIAHFVIAEANLQKDVPNSERRSDLFMLAALRAACDLGKDCSEHAFESLLQCAMVGSCEGSIFQEQDASVSREEWNDVARYQAEILAAVKAGSLSAVIEELRRH